MKRCRCCGLPTSTDADCYRGSEVFDGLAYLVHFVCPFCTAGFVVVMWEAPELADPSEKERDAA